jgi:hypothetical protein
MLVLGLLLSFGRACWATEDGSVQHYKMLSSVEYSGQGQFKNQVETLLTVRKQLLSDDKVRYFISSNDFDLLRDNLDAEKQSSSGELSFIVDEKTGRISGGGKDLGFLEKINNHCISSLKKVTKDNIGKTWKQSFDMPFLNHMFSGELKFTLTAIKLKTEAFGEVIAVRALSEPFVFKASGEEGNVGNVKSKIGAVYLFDQDIEDVYLSISVFEATANINGSKEQLRHEVGTYMTDSTGASVNLSGLGKEFEKLVQKVGLTKKGLKVEKETPLPQWAQYEGLAAGQVAHICAATACEGAPNPVVTVCIPTARTVAMQSSGTLTSIGVLGTGTVSSALAANVTGIGAMKIAVGPLIMGVSPMTAGLIGGGSAAVAAGAGGGGGGGGSRSPSS